jgi:hypothetical protein
MLSRNLVKLNKNSLPTGIGYKERDFSGLSPTTPVKEPKPIKIIQRAD